MSLLEGGFMLFCTMVVFNGWFYGSFFTVFYFASCLKQLSGEAARKLSAETTVTTGSGWLPFPIKCGGKRKFCYCALSQNAPLQSHEGIGFSAAAHLHSMGLHQLVILFWCGDGNCLAHNQFLHFPKNWY